ncbi:MAG: glycosyltransferase family protein [Burkholderiales bacterium]|nr:glycosyltransferase family protein [Burkholderiales bacterium]
MLGALMTRLARLARGPREDGADARSARLMRQVRQAAARGERARAASMLERLIARRPEDAGAHGMLAALRAQAGELAAALEHAGRAAALAPASPDAHLVLGNVRRLAGDLRGAEASYRRVIGLDPEAPAGHYSLALMLADAGRAADSLALLRRTHALAPGWPEPTWDLVRALLDAGEAAEARAAAERSVARCGASAPAWMSLGLVHLRAHEPEPAARCFGEAAVLAPGDAEAWLHAGIAAQELARLDEAQAAYERALRIAPGHAPARYRRALVLLLKREYGAAWPDYEARLESSAPPRREFPQPLWRGEPLAGRTLFVHAEQGLGDEIMFASCLPEVIERAGHCVIDCHPKLERLFRRSFPAATVHGGHQADDPAWLAAAPVVDCRIAAGSLPLLLRRRPADFPPHAGYLRADAARVDAFRARLAALGPGLKVGLSWRGGTELSRARLRSVELAALAPLVAVAGVRFVDLQYHDTAAERAAFSRATGLPLVHWEDALGDYDETAALVVALDLVVSVCTAIVHLAGALGRPAWVMTPYSPEWRYGQAGEDMPWYPSVRLVRQARRGEWGPVIAMLARDLAALAARARSRDA